MWEWWEVETFCQWVMRGSCCCGGGSSRGGMVMKIVVTASAAAEAIHGWNSEWKRRLIIPQVNIDYVKYFKEYYYPNTPTASLRIRSESKVDSASGLRVAVFLGWRSFCTASLFIPIAMHFFSLIQTMKMKCNWNKYLEDCFSFRKSTYAVRKILLTLLNTVLYCPVSSYFMSEHYNNIACWNTYYRQWCTDLVDDTDFEENFDLCTWKYCGEQFFY